MQIDAGKNMRLTTTKKMQRIPIHLGNSRLVQTDKKTSSETNHQNSGHTLLQHSFVTKITQNLSLNNGFSVNSIVQDQ